MSKALKIALFGATRFTAIVAAVLYYAVNLLMEWALSKAAKKAEAIR